MDKELLRIVIIGTGLLIIIGLLTWSYIKNKALQEENDSNNRRDPPAQKAKKTVKAKDKTPSPRQSPKITEAPIEPVTPSIYLVQNNTNEEEEEEEEQEPAPRMQTPTLIQFSLMSNSDTGFNGIDLVNAFSIVGLEYGSLKIYERLDAKRLVDYGVASMVDRGVFPDTDMDAFYTPGLVFFMQPAVLDDAQTIFDDFIETLQLLAIELDGTILDHTKQKLTDATIQAFRLSL